MPQHTAPGRRPVVLISSGTAEGNGSRNGALLGRSAPDGPTSTAVAIARAERIAQDTRALLHHDSDEEPQKASAVSGDAMRGGAAFASNREFEPDVAARAEAEDTLLRPTAVAGTDLAVALATAPRHSGIVNGIHAGRWTATAAKARFPAGSGHMQCGHDGASSGNELYSLSQHVRLPAPSFSLVNDGTHRQQADGQADEEPTLGGSRELTLKLSTSSNHDGSAGAAAAALVGVPAEGAMIADFAGFPGASAPSEPPLTLVLTPSSVPTQSSAEERLSAAAVVPTAGGEQLTLVLSPEDSSRVRGRMPQETSLSDGHAGSGGSLHMVLSSASGPAQLPRADGRSGDVPSQMTAPGPSPSSSVHQHSTSQPVGSSAEQQQQQQQQLQQRSVPSAQLDMTPRRAGPEHSSTRSVRAAEASGESASKSLVATPEAPSPAPQTGMLAAGPDFGGSAWRRTPEESPLPLGQPTPGPLRRPGSLPTPRTGASLRAALAPEGAPVTGGGPAGRSVRRRMSSLLARASSDHVNTPDVGPHPATAERARGGAQHGARRWGVKAGLATVREAPHGPGFASLREPPPTQVRAACMSECLDGRMQLRHTQTWQAENGVQRQPPRHKDLQEDEVHMRDGLHASLRYPRTDQYHRSFIGVIAIFSTNVSRRCIRVCSCAGPAGRLPR